MVYNFIIEHYRLLAEITGIIMMFFAGISFRIYYRTFLRGYLLIGMRVIICDAGLFLIILDKSLEIVSEILLGIAFVLGLSACLILGIVESGKSSMVFKGISFGDKLTGNVQILRGQDFPPKLKKTHGIAIGIFTIILGSSYLYLKTNIFSGSLAVVTGIAIIILSLIYGRR